MGIKKLSIVVFSTIITSLTFSQNIVATKSLMGLKFVIPSLDGFNLLDSVTASSIKTDQTTNIVTFYTPGFKDHITLHIDNNMNYSITSKQFNRLKQMWVDNCKEGKIMEGHLPIEMLIQFAEQFYANKPDTLQVIKERISKWSNKDVNLIVRNPVILYNNVYGIIISYDVSCENAGLIISTPVTEYAGSFLLKNKYFIFGGLVNEDSTKKNQLNLNLKTFAFNLISLNN